jgi:Zn-dependent protease with chaperone function
VSPAVSSLQLFMLAGLFFAAVGSCTAAVLVRLMSRPLLNLEPHRRHRVLVGLAAAPVLFSVVLLFSASLPSLISLLVPELDHCSTHDDGHAHLCFLHLPRVPLNLPTLLLLIFTTSYVLARWALSGADVFRSSRLLRALTATGLPAAQDVTILDTSEAVCMAAGLLQPRVLVSRGLLEQLGEEGQAVIFEHERAHIRRRDALIASLATFCMPLHVPGVGRWLLREIEIAAEQACDEETGAHIGDRTRVAEAILAVERLAQRDPPGLAPAGAVGFGDCAVVRRVESLLEDPKAPRSLWPVGVALGLVMLAVLLGSSRLHHTTESLISVIAH